MKIVVNNKQFSYDTGCRLLKTKYENCPIKELEEIWNDIKPYTFKEIAETFRNIEERRVGIDCIGINKLVQEINPLLINTQTIKKKTTWVDSDGNLINKEFTDTYELYEVTGKSLGTEEWSGGTTYYNYVKCKDTSTDREYLLWIDARDVYKTNNSDGNYFEKYGRKINAIQAVAWTIQTDVDSDDIEKIVRQGDCILIKNKVGAKKGKTRHLTEKEYRELLVLES